MADTLDELIAELDDVARSFAEANAFPIVANLLANAASRLTNLRDALETERLAETLYPVAYPETARLFPYDTLTATVEGYAGLQRVRDLAQAIRRSAGLEG